LSAVAAERSRRGDPVILSVLAEAQLEHGQAGDAARTVEEALHLPDAPGFLHKQLEECCRAAWR
jgi:hypothetical protein